MGKKCEHLYLVILESIQSGMDGSFLNDPISTRCEGVKDSQNVKACLSASGDPSVKDDVTLARFGALAVQHRMMMPNGTAFSLATGVRADLSGIATEMDLEANRTSLQRSRKPSRKIPQVTSASL